MPPSPASSHNRTRALVAGMLFCVTCVSYLDRVNLSVAGEAMMPALGLTKGDLSWIFNSFLLSYAIFQVPAGWLGDRVGAQRVLAWSTLVIGAVTLLTGLLPGRVGQSAVGTLVVLCGLRLLLGVAESATFPVATRVVSEWMPAERRGFGNATVLMGSSVGSAITAPLVSWAVVHLGWRIALGLSAVPAFLVGWAWLHFRRQPPDTAEEIAGAVRVRACASSRLTPEWLTVDVLLLALSYFAEGYLLFMFVSWLYIYLVEVRRFDLMGGGLAASLPWMTAMAATPLGGLAADRLAARFGRVRASQTLISAGYLLSGGLLFVAAFAKARPLAVLVLCLSLGALYLAESSFWTVANGLDSQRGGVISGFMNTVGILGGIASNALVPVLVERSGWGAAFGSATVMGVFTALVWLWLGRRLARSAEVSSGITMGVGG